jgi:hypothetical protein
VTPEELASATSIVEAFGLDRIYTSDSMPQSRPGR